MTLTAPDPTDALAERLFGATVGARRSPLPPWAPSCARAPSASSLPTPGSPASTSCRSTTTSSASTGSIRDHRTKQYRQAAGRGHQTRRSHHHEHHQDHPHHHLAGRHPDRLPALGRRPPLGPRPRRDLGSLLLACRATRARGSLPRLRAGAAWPRPQRRHAAVRDRARVRGHRRAGRVHRRAGVSARAFLRCDLLGRGSSAGGRPARARPLRAALRPERLRLPARIHRQPRGAARRRRSCGSDPAR